MGTKIEHCPKCNSILDYAGHIRPIINKKQITVSIFCCPDCDIIWHRESYHGVFIEETKQEYLYRKLVEHDANVNFYVVAELESYNGYMINK
jgi:hypothetical protein